MPESGYNIILVKRRNKRTVSVVLNATKFHRIKNFSQNEKVQFKSTYPLFNVTLIFQ